MKEDRRKYRLILLAFGISTALMLAKFVAYFITQSNAILSDALESIVNVMASGFGIYSIYLAALPRDKNHPYGHGKIEFFAEGIEGVLIILAGIFVVYHAIINLLNPHDLGNLDIGLWILIVGTALNYLLGYLLEKEGYRIDSITLKADGKHLMLDAQFGVLIILSVAIIYFSNWKTLDSIVSVLFGVYFIWNGIKMTRHSVGGLMDEVDTEILERIIEVLKKQRQDFWIDVHNLRVQKYGANLHIDCHLTLPNYMNLQKVHDSVHEFENYLKEEFKSEVELFVHTDPCLPECCSHCAVPNCSIRTENQGISFDWTVLNLTNNQKHFEMIASASQS